MNINKQNLYKCYNTYYISPVLRCPKHMVPYVICFILFYLESSEKIEVFSKKNVLHCHKTIYCEY